jgi:hypothetical protein
LEPVTIIDVNPIEGAFFNPVEGASLFLSDEIEGMSKDIPKVADPVCPPAVTMRLREAKIPELLRQRRIESDCHTVRWQFVPWIAACMLPWVPLNELP